MSEQLLEICCDSRESALAAASGGADRIELCVDLPADGLTPPVELLCEVKTAVEIPVFALVRCRAGGFVFSEEDLQVMRGEIVSLREAGADGIVCGALSEDGAIDVAATRGFVEAAGGVPFTFHKGFDACADLVRGMRSLQELGVDRVLTSGGGRLAADAMPTLARLAQIGGGKTRVLCGGGVRSANLSELVRIPGVTEFHSAARASVDRPVDIGEVRAMGEALRAYSISRTRK